MPALRLTLTVPLAGLLLLGTSAFARRSADVGVSATPFPARLLEASAPFVGTRYADSPLGEGEGRDVDPRFRTDAFDCLTLVEVSLARSLARTPDEVQPLLDRIRYSGAPSWETRNHLMEAQWLPHAVAQGFLKPVTRQLAGPAVRRVTKILSDNSWRGEQGQKLALPPALQPHGTFFLDVVPAADSMAVLSRSPTGTVVVVVAYERPGRVTQISHLGILKQTAQGPVLRHASRSYQKVVDEPLEHFLERNLGASMWSIQGLALYAPQAPPTRPLGLVSRSVFGRRDKGVIWIPCCLLWTFTRI